MGRRWRKSPGRVEVELQRPAPPPPAYDRFDDRPDLPPREWPELPDRDEYQDLEPKKR